jgi:predicted nucleotidyltransferase
MSHNTLEHEPWTAESGEQFLRDLSATLNQFGYEGRIVGSIATGENSDESDLDILLSPTDAARELDNFDIEGLYYALRDLGWDQGDVDSNYEEFWFVLSDNRVVDFFA